MDDFTLLWLNGFILFILTSDLEESFFYLITSLLMGKLLNLLSPPENIRIQWLPANATSIFQPLDQGIIQNAKSLLSETASSILN